MRHSVVSQMVICSMISDAVCDVILVLGFSRYYRTLEKQRQIDEREQQDLLRDRERFLLCAVDNFIKCLQHHDKYDLRVFRLISLWFDNACSDKVTSSMKVTFATANVVIVLC